MMEMREDSNTFFVRIKNGRDAWRNKLTPSEEAMKEFIELMHRESCAVAIMGPNDYSAIHVGETDRGTIFRVRRVGRLRETMHVSEDDFLTLYLEVRDSEYLELYHPPE